ncbi:MAG: hypothetical protein IJW50_04160 [Clostridia bacterium]|nr:hypothetical protein [Clostridia bacterium]
MEKLNLQTLFIEHEEQNQTIQSKIGYHFSNIQLLCQAFTRKSYAEENPRAQHNEVLEFYGDKALDFIVMKAMSGFYGKIGDDHCFFSNLEEGELTTVKAKIVCKSMLAQKVRELNFHHSLILGYGDASQKIHLQESVQEDLFEAILGAVAIDSNWNTSALEKVVERMLGLDACLRTDLQDEPDYVQVIQQWNQKKYGLLPEYTFQNWVSNYKLLEEFPQGGSMQCNLQLGSGMLFQSLGKNQVEARLATAKKAYHYLKNNNLLLSLTDEVGELVPEKAINQLQELYQKGFIGEPGYAFAEFSDADGTPVWECTCSVKGLDRAYSATHTSKQRAKKRAAYLMAWLYLGNMGDEHRDEA